MRAIFLDKGEYLQFLVTSLLTYSLLRNCFFHEKDKNDENAERKIPWGKKVQGWEFILFLYANRYFYTRRIQSFFRIYLKNAGSSVCMEELHI